MPGLFDGLDSDPVWSGWLGRALRHTRRPASGVLDIGGVEHESAAMPGVRMAHPGAIMPGWMADASALPNWRMSPAAVPAWQMLDLGRQGLQAVAPNLTSLVSGEAPPLYQHADGSRAVVGAQAQLAPNSAGKVPSTDDPRAMPAAAEAFDAVTAIMPFGSGSKLAMAVPMAARRIVKTALPKSKAARLERAREAGFFTEMPLYGDTALAGEQVGPAAMKVGDRVFTAPNHFMAMERAEAAFGKPFDSLPLAPIPDGFVTTGGRFVSRHEAAEIARRTNQARLVGPTGFPAWLGLASERLRPAAAPPAGSVRTGATTPGVPGGEAAAWLSMAPAEGTTVQWYRAANPVGADVSRATLPEIHGTLAEAWSRGHDAVVLRNYIRPGSTTPENVVVVRELNQLRVPRAMFDPAKRDSSDLMAGFAGAAVLGPTLTNMLDDQQ